MSFLVAVCIYLPFHLYLQSACIFAKMERGLVWPNTAWLLGRSSPSDYILSRLAGVFFLLMFYLFTLVKLGSL